VREVLSGAYTPAGLTRSLVDSRKTFIDVDCDLAPLLVEGIVPIGGKPLRKIATWSASTVPPGATASRDSGLPFEVAVIHRERTGILVPLSPVAAADPAAKRNVSSLGGSVRSRAIKDERRRTRGGRDAGLCGRQNADRRRGGAQDMQPAVIGGDGLVTVWAGTEEVAELVVAPTEPRR
jgi:hypothetical protein